MAYIDKSHISEARMATVVSIIAFNNRCTFEIRHEDVVFKGRSDDVRKACHDLRLFLEAI